MCELFKLARKNVKKTLKTEIESDSKGVEQICNLSCQERYFTPKVLISFEPASNRTIAGSYFVVIGRTNQQSKDRRSASSFDGSCL
jgi:hypothetical protein